MIMLLPSYCYPNLQTGKLGNWGLERLCGLPQATSPGCSRVKTPTQVCSPWPAFLTNASTLFKWALNIEAWGRIVSLFPALPGGTLENIYGYLLIDSRTHPPHAKYGYLFFFFRVTSVAYGSSQARGRIGAAAASLCLSHSHTRSEPCLWPTPQLIAMPVLNLPSKARDQTGILMDTSRLLSS